MLLEKAVCVGARCTTETKIFAFFAGWLCAASVQFVLQMQAARYMFARVERMLYTINMKNASEH